jgi:hypothetical protein
MVINAPRFDLISKDQPGLMGLEGKYTGLKLTDFVAVTDCDDIFLLRPAFWVLAGLDLSDSFWIDMRASSVGLPCR